MVYFPSLGGSSGGGGGGGGSYPVPQPPQPLQPLPPVTSPPRPSRYASAWGAGLNQLQSDYFNDPSNFNDALDQYFRSIGLTGNAYEYAMREANAIQAKFAKDSFAMVPDANDSGSHPAAPLLTEWLSQGNAGNLIHGYNMLSARARGANPQAFGTGRMMF